MSGSSLSFLNAVRKGFQRHLVATLVGLVCVYSIFFISQYVVVHNDIVSSVTKRQNEAISQVQRHLGHDSFSEQVVVEPRTWGNVSGLKADIEPLMMEYVTSMRKKGSRDVYKMAWEGPDVDMQGVGCGSPRLSNTNTSFRTTIIVHVHGARVDKALASLFQLIRLTDVQLVEDVILIGDVGLPVIYRDIYDLFADHLPIFRVFILPKRTTMTQARHYASHFAHGEILVFLDALVMVTKQWLEHIMAAILMNPKQVVQPVIVTNKTVLNGAGRPTYISRHEIQLDLTTTETRVLFGEEQTNGAGVIRDSLINPSAFALRKQLYQAIRGLEEYSGFSDIEMLVLSLKSWLCGGGVWLVPCSIVRLQTSINIADQYSPVSVKVSKPTSSKRSRHLSFVVSVWFSPFVEVYACLLPKTQTTRLTYMEKRTIRLYKAFYNNLQCNNFTHFVKLAQPNFMMPKRSTVNQGLIKIIGHDIFMTKLANDSFVFVKQISPNTFPFTYGNFTLTLGEKCVTYVQNNTIALKPCQHKHPDQQWRYSGGMLQLRNRTHLCIVKYKENNYPTVRTCKGENMRTRFNFSFTFATNCMK